MLKFKKPANMFKFLGKDEQSYILSYILMYEILAFLPIIYSHIFICKYCLIPITM